MITMGVVYSTFVDENGNPRCSVMDESGTLYSSVVFGGDSGGSTRNFSHSPVSFSGELGKVDRTSFDGEYVLLLHIGASVPILIGTLPSPLQETRANVLFLKTDALREFTADQQHQVGKAHIEDEYRKVQGATRTMGEHGFTVDTQGTGGKPIRFQTDSEAHVRVSQTGHLTTGHVVLSAPLMSKLTELETVIDDMATVINRLSIEVGILQAALSTVAGAGNGNPLTSAAPFSPPIMEEHAVVESWEKGRDARYQADCFRISNKTVGG